MKLELFKQRLFKRFPTSKIKRIKIWKTGHWVVRFTLNGHNMGVDCPPSALNSSGNELFQMLDRVII